MPKFAWVLVPLAAYLAWVALAAWRGRAPSRFALNVQTSLLLMVYVLTTASLGVFWVANQQLPVFDIHYLFGYATLLLVVLHLSFNLPIVVRWLRKPAADPVPERRSSRRRLALAAVLLAALGGAFVLGTREGGGAPALRWNEAAPSLSGPVEAVIRYHEYSSDSRASVFRRAAGIEWGAAPPPFKRYAGVPQLALPRAGSATLGLSAALRQPPARNAHLRLAELGDLLHLAAGVTLRRGGNALRAAPSSGALFPTELYVLASGVDGLPPGLYHYDPEHERLDALGALPAAPLAAPAGADALLVLSSVFRRTGYKYRDRAYRYVTADAGHLLENLRLAAHAAGMRATPLARFDDAAAARAIGVDGVEEGVLALLDLRPSGSTAPAPGAPPGRFVTPPATDSPLGATGLVQRATSLSLAAEDAAGAATALPAPEAAQRSVQQTIAERRSKRRFRDTPLPLSALASILADMAQAPQLSGALRINLVANRVAGLAPGVYRYRPPHGLVLVRAGDFAAAAQSAALSQDVIGDAAAVLVLSAGRDTMLADGARGYRHAYLEAGMLGERWLLGATARRLGACPVGAFYDDEAAALIGADPKREWVLHFAALGWPAE